MRKGSENIFQKKFNSVVAGLSDAIKLREAEMKNNIEH